MRKKVIIKTLSCFLALIIVFQSLPLSALAEQGGNNNEPETITFSNEEIEIVQEIPELEQNGETVYLLENGTFATNSSLEISDENNDIQEGEDFTEITKGCLTVFQETENYDENNDEFTMDDYCNGVVINIDNEQFNNSFIKDAYINIHTVDSEDSTVSVAEITNNYSSFDDIDYNSNICSNLIPSDDSTVSLNITQAINNYVLGNNEFGVIVYSNEGLSYDEMELVVNYRNIVDIDPNIESEIINMDRAGTVYINDFTCSPTIIRNDIGLDGYLAPVQIQNVFNGSLDNPKFRPNYESTISYIPSNEDPYFVWNSVKGENLYFTLTNTTNNTQTYEAIDSEGKTYSLYWTPNNGTFSDVNYTDIKIVDQDEVYYYYFYNYGYLKNIRIKDNNNCKISIRYTSYTDQDHHTLYHVSKIIDGADRVYEFTYDNSERLSKIQAYNVEDDDLIPILINNTQMFVSYSYSTVSEHDVITISYTDNEQVKYYFDSNSRITKIVSNNGNYLELYYNDDFDSINNYKLKSISNNELINISIDATSPYRRTFEDNLRKEDSGNNMIKVLDFDEDFNLVYLENFDNSNYYIYENASSKSILKGYTSKNSLKNGDFTSNLSNWSNGNNTTNTNRSTKSNSDRRLRSSANCICLKKASNKVVELYQDIETDFDGNNFVPNDKYIIEAYAECQNAEFLRDNSEISVRVEAYVNNSPTILGEMNYQTYIELWQTKRLIFTIPENTSKLRVVLSAQYISGECLFDAVKLYKHKDNKHSTTDSTSYIYDDFGRLTTERITGVSLIKEKSYNYNGNKLSSIINDGNATYYHYNDDTGLLESYGSVQNQNKHINLSYNGMGALISSQITLSQLNNESQTNLSNYCTSTSYSNEHDKVVSVTHNGFTYNIEYDAYGNISNVKINNSSIYSYNEKVYTNNEKHYISSITYGDGTTVFCQKYSDNEYYNVINIYETTQQNPNINNLDISYQFRFDYDGSLFKYVDYENNTTSIWRDNTYCVLNSTKSGLITELDKYVTYKTADSLETIVAEYNDEHENENGFKKVEIIYYTDNSNIINLFDYKYHISSSESESNNLLTSTTSYSIYDDEAPNESIKIAEVSTTTDDLNREKSATISYENEDEKLEVESEYYYKNINGYKTTDKISEYSEDLKLFDISIPEGTNVPTYTLQGERTISYSYDYDSVGKISNVYYKIDEHDQNSPAAYEKIKHYEYDELGQIIEEVDLEINRCTLYYYDVGGNITEKRIYQNVTDVNNQNVAFTYNASTNELSLIDCTKDIQYGYTQNNNSEWNDLLTSYDGNQIQYDNCGNPTTYYGVNIFGNDVSGNMEWSGKKLVAFSNDKSRYEYTYNADGLRTKKTTYNMVENEQHEIIPQLYSITEYIWDNDIVVGYKNTYYNERGVASHNLTIKPIYDSENNIKGIHYINMNLLNKRIESFGNMPILKDGMGNIVTISANGNSSFNFNYDAYGNTYINIPEIGFDSTTYAIVDVGITALIAFAIAIYAQALFACTQQNYRGYLYDMETGLYYNQTRYYSPAWARFINPDEFSSLLDEKTNPINSNLFCYCDNDPINYTDPSGFSTEAIASEEGLLNLAGIKGIDAFDVDASKTSTYFKTKSGLIESSLNINETSKEVWNNKFKYNPFTLYKNDGFNYLTTNIDCIGNPKVDFYQYKERALY